MKSNFTFRQLIKLPATIVAFIAVCLFSTAAKVTASTEVWPSTFATPMTGSGTYCLNATPNPLTATWVNQSCSTGNSGTDYDAIIINWYANTTLSNTGGTLVQSTSTLATSVSDSYTPSTATYGTTYYYVVVSWVGGEYCSPLSGSITTSVSQMDSVVVTNLAITSVSVLSNACNGSNIGNAQANIVGCSTPFSYSWTNSSSTVVSTSNPSRPLLSAGTYTVTVTDATSATATGSVTITSSPPIVVNWWSHHDVKCFGGTNGNAISNVYGGTTPYSYLWSDGNTTGSDFDMSANTSYTLTVTDNNGCTGTNSISLTQPTTALSETVTKNSDLTCHANKSGSATSNPAGGTAPYTFSWLPSGGNLQTSVTLPAGNIGCFVTDNHGCTTSASVTLTQPTVIFATFTKTIPLCNGNSNGTITATGTGGSGSYTGYFWAPYAGNSATANGLSAQIYTVTITDNTGCTGSAPVVLSQPHIIAVSVPTFTCVAGGKGTEVANATGGTPAYHYTWSNGSTTTSSTNKTQTLPNGSYTVTVTDSHGCPSASTNFVISGCPAIKMDGVDRGNDNGEEFTDITIYPNPTHGQFTLSSSGLSDVSTQSSVEIYNLLGEKVYSQLLPSGMLNSFLINISNQPNGIYLVRILDKDGKLISNKKVVKTN